MAKFNDSLAGYPYIEIKFKDVTVVADRAFVSSDKYRISIEVDAYTYVNKLGRQENPSDVRSIDTKQLIEELYRRNFLKVPFDNKKEDE